MTDSWIKHCCDRALAVTTLALLLSGCPGNEPGASESTAGSSGVDTGQASSTGTGQSSTPDASSGEPVPGSSTDVDVPTTAGPGPGSATGDTGDTSATGDTGDTGEPPLEGWAPRDHARLFLSGHSLTDNPLADDLELLAQSLGKDFAYNQQIGIGSPIRVRTLGDSWDNLDWPGYKTGKNRDGSDMDVIAELASPQTLGPGERYDTLVITERHDILGTIQWEDTAGLLRHYHDRFIAGNADGATLFYHSWLDIDKSAPANWIAHEKNALYAWECVANKVNHTLADEGRPDRLVALPVGAALVDLVERTLADEIPGITGSTAEKMNAIFSDNVHLTSLGVYYAALVTYSAIFRDSPVGGAVPEGVDPTSAEALQALAWEFVRAYYTAPGSGQHTMEECRDLVANSVCASFWTLRGEPGQVAGCQAHFSGANNEGNPFKWPDPGLMVWPAP